MKQPAVYIMATRRNGTLYTGVTSNLARRVHQRREALIPGFTSRYGCKMLVWYEIHEGMIAAIAREKRIKGGSREKKMALIEALTRRGGICAKTRCRASRHPPPSLRAGGEAIQTRARPLDCFVATLLAMTARRQTVNQT